MTRRQKLARLFADRKPRRVTFTKKNGTSRTMSFQYQGGAIQGGYMTVFDLDKQAFRKLNLSTVQGCGVVLHEAKKGFDDIKQQLHALMF